MKGTGVEVWYTDGNMAEDKRVRAGWSNGLADRQEVEGNEALGRIATVWDGEVCGMRGALRRQDPDWSRGF